MIEEPFLAAELEDDTSAPDWHERVLNLLAQQLSVRNDFYFPLLGAVQKLEAARLGSRPEDEDTIARRLFKADSHRCIEKICNWDLEPICGCRDRAHAGAQAVLRSLAHPASVRVEGGKI